MVTVLQNKPKFENHFTKRLLTVFGILVIFIIGEMLPVTEELTLEGKRALILMVCATISWMTNVVPLMFSALFFLICMPILGIDTLPGTADAFCEPIFFFIVASYALFNGLTTTGLDRRITLMLAIASKGNPQKLLFIVMCSAALISTVISDMGAVLMYIPILLMLFKATGLKPGESSYAKAMMIGLPVAALVGGMGTPAGSSTNVLALAVLENSAGVKIVFTQWMALAMPVVIILTPIVYLIIRFCYPAEISQLNGLEDAKAQLDELGPMKLIEKKYLIVMLVIIIVWLTEGFHGYGIPITSTIGALLFFLPGIDILNWENTKNVIRWEIVMVVCVCCALGGAIWKTGAAAWIAQIVSGVMGGFTPVIILLLLGLFVSFIHLVCPINPALVSIIVPIASVIAINKGINPAFLAIPVGFMVSCACLIPLDAVPLVCYGTGYFKMHEMFKSGLIITIAWVLITALVMLTVAPLLGLL
ncbi:MAG: SLC13 family permease [Peptococcaceae bacterium]